MSKTEMISVHMNYIKSGMEKRHYKIIAQLIISHDIDSETEVPFAQKACIGGTPLSGRSECSLKN